MGHVTAPNAEGGLVIDERANYRLLPTPRFPSAPGGRFQATEAGVIRLARAADGGSGGGAAANGRAVRERPPAKKIKGLQR